MGVRLSLYAIDMDYIERISHRLLVNVMQQYVQMECSETLHTTWEVRDPHTGRTIYKVISGKGISQIHGKAGSKYPQQPFLSDSLQQYVGQLSSFQLKTMLDAFDTCWNPQWVKRIVSDQRRWWIGSFMEALATRTRPDDYNTAAIMMKKLLRHFDCGTVIRFPDQGSRGGDFPLVPGDDADLLVGFWTPREVQFMLELLAVFPPKTIFSAPTGPIGITPEDSEEWNNWVWSMVTAIQGLPNLPFANAGIVSFIG